jgi:hypothetical protein
MAYYFIDWEHTEQGYRPAIPEDLPFLMLAEPGAASEGATFGLFECDFPEGVERPDSVHRVPSELAELIDSAKDYPPALALVRHDPRLRASLSSPPEFGKVLGELLVNQLHEQIAAPFFLAKARRTEVGYKDAGGYYWIVGYDGEKVRWVSRDYHVYTDLAEDFDLDMVVLEKRFREKRRTP